jgi:hypothetical protein
VVGGGFFPKAYPQGGSLAMSNENGLIAAFAHGRRLPGTKTRLTPRSLRKIRAIALRIFALYTVALLAAIAAYSVSE